VEDCFPAQLSDTLRSDLKKGSFTKDFLGQGVRHSFLEVVQDEMDGRASRGRGHS
jgi:hypothetical protein